MGRIVDARGEEALGIAAELIGILTEIAGDRTFTEKLAQGAAGKMSAGEAASLLLTDHGKAVLRLFALDDGVSAEEEARTLSPAAVPGRLLGLFRDPALQALFGSAAAGKGGDGSSAA